MNDKIPKNFGSWLKSHKKPAIFQQARWIVDRFIISRNALEYSTDSIGRWLMRFLMFQVLVIMIVATNALAAFSENANKIVYTDTLNHVSWLEVLPKSGRFSNGCSDIENCSYIVDSSGAYQVDPSDSEAAKHCLNAGARLPTLNDYFSLIRNFDHTTSGGQPYLSANGRQQIEKAIGGYVSDGGYWTSTINANSVYGSTPNLNAYIYIPWGLSAQISHIPRNFNLFTYTRCVVD